MSLSPTLVNPGDADDVITKQTMDRKIGYVINTMVFYQSSDQQLEVLAGKLSECVESRNDTAAVVFFLPISVADFDDPAGLKQLLTLFRRKVSATLSSI